MDSEAEQKHIGVEPTPEILLALNEDDKYVDLLYEEILAGRFTGASTSSVMNEHPMQKKNRQQRRRIPK